jgi:hypothetical protein
VVHHILRLSGSRILLVQWGKIDGPYGRFLEVGGVEGPRVTAVVIEPPSRVKIKSEKELEHEDADSIDAYDWALFGSLMAEVLAEGEEDVAEGPTPLE